MGTGEIGGEVFKEGRVHVPAVQFVACGMKGVDEEQARNEVTWAAYSLGQARTNRGRKKLLVWTAVPNTLF